MATPERSSVPTYVPDELQQHYGREARQRVAAAHQVRHDPRASERRTPRRWLMLTVLTFGAAGVAGPLGLHAASWLVGAVMFVILVVLAVVTMAATRALVARLTPPTRAADADREG